MLLRKRHNPAKTGNIDGSVKTHGALLDCGNNASTIHVHCYSLKHILTEENKWASLEMALHFIYCEDPTKYQDMCDQIHLDEKWFFLMWDKERYLLFPEEKNPKCCIKHKSYITKVMFLHAVNLLDLGFFRAIQISMMAHQTMKWNLYRQAAQCMKAICGTRLIIPGSPYNAASIR